MQNLIENINKELIDLGFNEIKNPEYLASYEKVVQVQKVCPTMFINGQPIQSQPNIINKRIKISYYEGDILDVTTKTSDPLLFITFLVFENDELIIEDELSFYREDFTKFKNILTNINY